MIKGMMFLKSFKLFLNYLHVFAELQQFVFVFVHNSKTAARQRDVADE